MKDSLGYLHEVWLCPNEHGQSLPACIPVGPDGDAARALNEPGSEWVWTFWTRSHAETMVVYYEFVGYGEYCVLNDLDRQPYSSDAYERQTTYLFRDDTISISGSEARR
ncbi:hypothetical protein SAMN04487926_13034 [Paraburkholderia steynii]|uniref:Uncharacterized protein n=1 Tax=Paraburkholderia steynii TaxID=1245441 RepID=A0A7Z7BF58_9BURK|nr:hypothetical protein SAMN04487926_13034 [Paraburkholderia steynii]